MSLWKMKQALQLYWLIPKKCPKGNDLFFQFLFQIIDHLALSTILIFRSITLNDQPLGLGQEFKKFDHIAFLHGIFGPGLFRLL